MILYSFVEGICLGSCSGSKCTVACDGFPQGSRLQRPDEARVALHITWRASNTPTPYKCPRDPMFPTTQWSQVSNLVDIDLLTLRVSGYNRLDSVTFVLS